MIAIALLLQAAVVQPTHVNFVCQRSDGRSFSVVAPLAIYSDMRVAGQELGKYEVSGVAGEATPDVVLDARPGYLTLVWDRDDGSELTVEIEDYDRDAGSAKFGIRQTSAAGALIQTVSATSGRCLVRETVRSARGAEPGDAE